MRQLVNVSSHSLKVGLASADQVPDLRDIVHMLVSLKLISSICYHFISFILVGLGDSVKTSDNVAVQADDPLTLDKVFERRWWWFA